MVSIFLLQPHELLLDSPLPNINQLAHLTTLVEDLALEVSRKCEWNAEQYEKPNVELLLAPVVLVLEDADELNDRHRDRHEDQ